MGRSRGVHNSTEEDTGHRSKRRRVAPPGDNVEAAVAAQGTTEGKKALYHCNYCNKDISGKIRIKCTTCPDFDLCVECFSVGAAVKPHESIHTYRVMDNLSFPLIYPDWNADEEILLLEGIEMYGLGNWAEVAEHVGTKSKAQCIEHYTTAYMNSPCYPLPDMSHVVGKNRKELLAMAKVHGDGKRGFSMAGETPKEDSKFSPRIKNEEAAPGCSPSSFTSEGNHIDSKMKTVGFSEGKKALNTVHVKKDGSDGIKVENMTLVEDSQVDRSIGGKKPKYSVDESITAQSGYNPKRQEFDPEYDNDAEQPLAEMEFKDNDTEAERELKLRVLHIYHSRLDERKRRKDFILERNLLYPNPLENKWSPEDRQLYERCKVFMRFHTQEEHDAFVHGLIMERNIRKRIQELQECRAAGCHTMAEAERYSAQRRLQESEANKPRESGSEAPSSKIVQKSNCPMNREKGESEGSVQAVVDGNQKIKCVTTGVVVNGKDLSPTVPKSFDEWDVTGLPGAELLSDNDVQLCCECRLLPVHYLKMQETLAVEIFKGKITHKSDAYPLFNVDPTKVDRVYDMLVKKGLVKSEEVLAS